MIPLQNGRHIQERRMRAQIIHDGRRVRFQWWGSMYCAEMKNGSRDEKEAKGAIPSLIHRYTVLHKFVCLRDTFGQSEFLYLILY